MILARLFNVLSCVALLATTGTHAAETQPDLLTPAERAWLAAHPRIVLGIGRDWAPWIVMDGTGAMTGFVVEHLALLNRKLGTDIRLEASAWNDIVRKAERGELDGLTLTAPLDARRAHFVFTETFVTGHDFIFQRAADVVSDRSSAGLHDLRGKRVGYLKGTLRVRSLLEPLPDVIAVPVESFAELAQKLIRGEIDVAVAAYSFEYWRTSNGVLGIIPTQILRESESRLVMSIRKDWQPLAGILNKALAAISREELAPIYRRWFGADYLERIATFGGILSAEERAWLKEHPVLRAGIVATDAPIQYVEGRGTAKGMSVAYLQRLEKLLGFRVELVPLDSHADALQRIHQRQVDLLPAIVPSHDRTPHMAFTTPYLSFPAVIYAAASPRWISSPGELKGKVVAVIRGDVVEDWLRSEWPDVVRLPAKDVIAALRAVARGEAVAFIGNQVSTDYYIGQLDLSQIRVAGETSYTYRLGMAVPADHAILAGILRKGIEAIPAHDQQTIYRDWIAVRYEHRIDYSLLWQVMAGAAALVFAVLLERSFAMRRANARLRQLSREAVRVEELERKRFATELHDSPMQKLAIAQMQLSSARQDVEGEGTENMAAALEMLREAIEELRTLQFELSPPMLHQEGLGAALGWLAARTTERSGVVFTYRGSTAPNPSLSQELELVLYQCARELVYNVVKHASARTASIKLGFSGGNVILTVADGGKGVAKTETSASRGGGFGLFSVRERLALYGGSFTLASDATGTKAIARVPLRSDERRGQVSQSNISLR